jgi:hypothetical protein
VATFSHAWMAESRERNGTLGRHGAPDHWSARQKGVPNTCAWRGNPETWAVPPGSPRAGRHPPGRATHVSFSCRPTRGQARLEDLWGNKQLLMQTSTWVDVGHPSGLLANQSKRTTSSRSSHWLRHLQPSRQHAPSETVMDRPVPRRFPQRNEAAPHQSGTEVPRPAPRGQAGTPIWVVCLAAGESMRCGVTPEPDRAAAWCIHAGQVRQQHPPAPRYRDVQAATRVLCVARSVGR